MRATIRRVLNTWMEHPEGQAALGKIGQLRGNAGYQAYQNFVLFMKAEIRETALSKEFDKMDKDEQVSLLRSLRWMDEFLDWCLNPMAEIEKSQAYKRHNANIVKMPSKGKGA